MTFIDSFVEYCKNMIIAVEETIDLPPRVKKDKDKVKLLREAINNLLKTLNEDMEAELRHANNKHSDYDHAKKYFKEGKTVSYFIKNAKLFNLTKKAIEASRNDIVNQLYWEDDITITYGFGQTIGKMHKGGTISDKDDKDLSAIRIGIINIGEDENGVPILKVKSSYPIPEKNRLFPWNRRY